MVVVERTPFSYGQAAQLFLELSPAGVLNPTYAMRTMKMDLFNNISDLVQMIFEGLLYILLLLYVSNEFVELYDTVKATGSVREYTARVERAVSSSCSLSPRAARVASS